MTPRQLERVRAYSMLRELMHRRDLDWDQDLDLQDLATRYFEGHLLRAVEACEPLVRAGWAEWSRPIDATMTDGEPPWGFGAIRLTMATVLLLDLLREGVSDVA